MEGNSSPTRKRWSRGQRSSRLLPLLPLIILLILLPGQGSGIDQVNVDPASSLPRTLVRAPSGGFGQPGANPNVISIGAVLESQEAIAQFLQVSSLSLTLLSPSTTSFSIAHIRKSRKYELIMKNFSHSIAILETFWCKKVIEEISLEPSINAPGVTLYAVSIPLIHNPVRTAQAVCEKLIKSQVCDITFFACIPNMFKR